MSDDAVKVPGAVADNVTAGMLLRRAREASGLHVAALAVSMKVPVKKLEALEADRLEDLPDAVFVRALAASVCRTLKVDPAPVLNKLPLSAAPRLGIDDRGVSMPAQGAKFLAGQSMGAVASRPTAMLVAALLLAAVAVALFPEARNSVGFADSTKTLPAVLLPVVPLPSGLTKDAPPASAADALAKAAVNVPVAQASDQAFAATTETAALQAAAPAKAVSAVAAASPAESSTASGLLVFKARSQAWVRVSDSRGVVQFEKTLAPGESAAASGAVPLSVVVGNVAATEVVLRGQPFPLDTLNQNNVARFEVK
jgi:cytoskeleton protein RodZ